MNQFNYDYEGNEIPFRVDEDNQVFMNATAMMEPFPGKRMHNFTRNKTTVEFINALHEKIGVTPISVTADSQLIMTKQGGIDQGTWFHEDLAIYFAQWLNPRFGVWCNQRIKEILNQGFSALTPEAREHNKEHVGEAFSPLLYLI